MLIPLSPRQLHEEMVLAWVMGRLLNDFLQEPTKVLPQGLPGSHRTGKKIVSHDLRCVRIVPHRTKLL